MGKFVPKFRPFDDEYSSEYNPSKEFNKNKKRKKEVTELRRMRQRQHEDTDYGFLEKRYNKL